MKHDNLLEIEKEADELLKRCKKDDTLAIKIATAVRDTAKKLRREQN